MDNYIYLIKYNGEVIAAAADDKNASAVINKYITRDKTMERSFFEKEAIRFFDRKDFSIYDCMEEWYNEV